jgi:hypothetical protein
MIDLRVLRTDDSHVQLLVQEGVDQHAAVLICWELQLVAQQAAAGSPPLHPVILVTISVITVI